MSPKNSEKPTLVRQEIRYRCPSATEVRLVWGINNWKAVPEEDRPVGTFVRRAVMQTPMKDMGDYFSMTVFVPAGAVLDFGFLITQVGKGADVRIWDADGADSIHRKVSAGNLIEIISTADTRQASKAPHEGWKAFPQLLVALGCVALALRGGMRIVNQKRKAWQRKALLPNFRRPANPSWFVEAGIIGLSLLVGIVSAEGILHLTNPDDSFGAGRELGFVRKGRETVEKTMRVDTLVGLRPRLNYGLYNEYGTKTNDYSPLKASGTKRLIVLGSKAVFEGQLMDAFEESSPQGVEIWNGGVESFGTVQAINFYNQYQSRIKPDKIILVITPSDLETAPITYLNNQKNFVALLPYLPSSSLNHFLFANSLLYRLFIGIKTVLTNHEDRILEETRTELQEFARSCDKQGTSLLVVVLPLLYPEDVWSAVEKHRHTALLEMVRLTYIKHIDLLPAVHHALNERLPLHHQTANPFQPSKPLAQRFVSSVYGYDPIPSTKESTLIGLQKPAQ